MSTSLRDSFTMSMASITVHLYNSCLFAFFFGLIFNDFLLFCLFAFSFFFFLFFFFFFV